MPLINFNYTRLPADEAKYGKGFGLNSLPKLEFESFNSDKLGLGDLSKDGKYINALAAFLDLKGFTEFCNQVDSHLVIPEFLRKYVDWVFKQLAENFKESEDGEKVKIWGSLPF